MEVLRISTVVDEPSGNRWRESFGSAKNFYCCRSCRPTIPCHKPLEVLRISTVVDELLEKAEALPLEVLRISTVVDNQLTL